MKFKFLKKNDSHKLFEERLTVESMESVKGGTGGKCTPVSITKPCNPWLSCDAWNCAPDCNCVSTFA